MAYFTVAVAWITWRSLVRVENCSGRTWVRTSNREVLWARGILRLAPGCRGCPVTLPRVVTTATFPAGTMNTVCESSTNPPRMAAKINCQSPPKPLSAPERMGDCIGRLNPWGSADPRRSAQAASPPPMPDKRQPARQDRTTISCQP